MGLWHRISCSFDFITLPNDNIETRNLKKIVFGIILFSAFNIAGNGWLLYQNHAHLAAYNSIICALLLFVSVFILFITPKAWTFFVWWGIIVSGILQICNHIFLGGFFSSGGSMFWSVLNVLGTVIVFKNKWAKYAVLWTFIVFITIFAFYETDIQLLRPNIPDWLPTYTVTNILIAMLFIIFFIFNGYVIGLRKEKETSQRLLHEVSQQKEEITAQRDEIEQQRDVVVNQKKQITDSINYAARIQQAILGNIESIEKQLGNAFIFFSPHSVVSGDFYWYAQIDNKQIIIAADCTGHGVPGAFMTVMAHDFLYEIVHTQKIWQPDQITSHLDQRITQRLHQQAGAAGVNDGMDMAIAVIDHDTNKIHVSGAKNSVYRYSQGEMHEIKTSKFPIGGSALYAKTDKTFDMQSFELIKGDVLYLFSDGFEDQIGGEKDRKYLIKNFRLFLSSIATYTPDQQKTRLHNELQRWKGNQHQTDDILVIGTIL